MVFFYTRYSVTAATMLLHGKQNLVKMAQPCLTHPILLKMLLKNIYPNKIFLSKGKEITLQPLQMLNSITGVSCPGLHNEEHLLHSNACFQTLLRPCYNICFLTVILHNRVVVHYERGFR